MYYLKSTQPNETISWSSAQQIGVHASASAPNSDQYTYVSLLTDGYSPIVVARFSGDGYSFKLATLTGNGSGGWGEQQIVLDPGRIFYGHWYQRLSIDPWGRLFLNYLYYPDSLFSDEAAVLNNAFGYSLTPASGCVATTRAGPNANYCHYDGYGTLTNGVMMSPGLGRAFQLAGTKAFFQF
jgi:hypothetical protein